MSGGVFICYRREDSPGAARAIHDRVVQWLERENVFLDVDDIDLGVDWLDVLTQRVGACDALVVVIGRTWVSGTDKDNRRRLDDPDDFVRIEIEAALNRDVPVIPVLVDGAVMPKTGELPDSLKSLARRQGIEISHARFNADVEKLTRVLASILEDRRSRNADEEEKVRRKEEERRAREPAEAEVKQRTEAPQAPRATEAERAARKQPEEREDAERADLSESGARPRYYVSYARADGGDPNRERDVDRLCEEAQRRGISVLRDKKDLRFGELISDFIKELGEGDRVFIFLSDKYLKSPYCMLELFELWRNSKQPKPAPGARHYE